MTAGITSASPHPDSRGPFSPVIHAFHGATHYVIHSFHRPQVSLLTEQETLTVGLPERLEKQFSVHRHGRHRG